MMKEILPFVGGVHRGVLKFEVLERKSSEASTYMGILL